jgi:hypothetical protein
MLSPKDIYPLEWFKESKQRAKGILLKEGQLRSSPQFSSRRLPSGCLLIQLGVRPVTGTLPTMELHNVPR